MTPTPCRRNPLKIRASLGRGLPRERSKRKRSQSLKDQGKSRTKTVTDGLKTLESQSLKDQGKSRTEDIREGNLAEVAIP